jgi:two-component system, NarL family, sensor histidine kinase DesK
VSAAPVVRATPWLQRLRRPGGIAPGDGGWPPYLRLLYLGFLFMPLLWRADSPNWLAATLISLPPFLLLYVGYLRKRWPANLALVLALALLSLLLQPFNPYANTYLVYAAALAPFALPGLVRPLCLTVLLLLVQAGLLMWCAQPLLISGITAILCIISCVGNAYARERRSRDAALQLSQEEVRRLAAIAERERIGRDLHDLLGHTLSLIALKGELAGKLLTRDLPAAAGEISEVTQIARDALAQVRTAVTGMRAAALAGELASARNLLESSGVALTCSQEPQVLPAPIETALALIVREAATNIQRHSGATRASIAIGRAAERRAAVALRVSDNGRGGATQRGNGLSGMGERVQALGGTLEIDSAAGGGTVLQVILPVAP